MGQHCCVAVLCRLQADVLSRSLQLDNRTCALEAALKSPVCTALYVCTYVCCSVRTNVCVQNDYYLVHNNYVHALYTRAVINSSPHVNLTD